ncbi:MAG TPA: di-heme oxidoredictase family protein [Gemmatimonadales bacterium]|jgi:CxxC motif-containing protein (DUF1111 family)|nr:di-heme oxidoredictase family protein [Gemmatimonadales bacterium]
MLHTSRSALLLAALMGIAACKDDAPTGAPPISEIPSDEPPAADVLNAAVLLGRPLARLTAAQRQRFNLGRAVFQTEFTPETGLGPLFNAVGCANCHEEPVVGGGGSNDPEEGGEDIELHATAFHGGGQCDDLAAIGGQVIQKQVTPALGDILHITAEPIPAAATDSGHRTTPDVFGFGLLDAVPDATILAHADPFDRDGDGISGRPNRTPDGRIGRFGRKAQAATLREFNGDAFVMEMGVTNPVNQSEQLVAGQPLPDGVDPLPEPEITGEQLDAADAFVRFLAPSPREPLDAVGAFGALVFRKVGCNSCHVPTLVTGANRVAALRFRQVRAFTDLLLHDMGPDLADICLGQAQPSEFRTEPLMGLRFATAFLHDGRAPTIAQAIALHGGEGLRARNRFLRLTVFERRALLRFLKSL